MSVPDAVASTVATAGRTVTFTAVAVMAALAALLVFPLYFLRSFGYAGIGVVAIAALGALVVLPALLAVLGHRVNAGKLPWSRAVTGAASPFWGRLAARVMRRPVLAALPVMALLALAASPLLGVRFGTPDQGVLRTTVDSRQVSDTLVSDFPGNSSAPIDVVTTGALDPAAVADYAIRLSQLPDVAQVASSAGTFSHGHAQPAGAVRRPWAGPTVSASRSSRRCRRSRTAARIWSAPSGPGPVRPGASVLVTGDDAQLIDTRHVIAQRLPLALGLVLLTTLVVLFLFTGSVVQPVRAVLLNALSLGATLGVMTWVFQNGHLAGLLGLTPRPMDMSMTVLLFCIAFGLSMDYEVFVMSRIKEMHDRGVPATQAVPAGLSHAGRIVSTAAGLLAVSFFAFGTSTVSFLQMFGIGAGLAILIDATLVRGVLVPAAMRLLGPAAWYSPRPLRRAYGRIALSEG